MRKILWHCDERHSDLIRPLGRKRPKRRPLRGRKRKGFYLRLWHGGAETFGVNQIIYSFDMAREAGLRITTHAGNGVGPKVSNRRSLT